MDIQSGNVSSMVFKTSIKADMEEIPLDGQMLILLMEFDGKTNVGMIAQMIGMSMTTVSKSISKILDHHLIQVVSEKKAVEQNPDMLDKEFFDFLTEQLSIYAGPISQLMVEDATHEIDQESSGVPKKRAAELIDLLARQIPEGSHSLLFIQSMMQKLKEL